MQCMNIRVNYHTDTHCHETATMHFICHEGTRHEWAGVYCEKHAIYWHNDCNKAGIPASIWPIGQDPRCGPTKGP